MRAGLLSAIACCWAVVCSTPMPSYAQDVGVVQSEILVIDPDRLFNESLLGQRLNTDYQAQRDEMIARNRSLETELESEEQALTQLRDQTSPEEFRDLADAFDLKVQRIRRESDRAVRDLEQNRERAPVLFMRTVEPVLAQIMADAGGVVLLDVRSVLLRTQVVDITDLAISRINDQVGTGETPAEQPSEGASEQ